MATLTQSFKVIKETILREVPALGKIFENKLPKLIIGMLKLLATRYPAAGLAVALLVGMGF